MIAEGIAGGADAITMASGLTGWPMFTHISPLGCMVGSGSTDMCRMPGISADRVLPSIRNVIGTLRTPRFLLISGANAAMGPPAPPVKIAARASVWSSLAR